MPKKFAMLIAIGAALVIGALVLKFGNFGTAFLWNISNGGTWLLPLVAVSSLIDSINPCAFSILLLTIAFLFSIGSVRMRILAIGSAYIIGIFIIYVLIGLGILQALHLFSTPHFMAKVGAGILILWGAVNIISEFFPAFPIKPRIPHAAHRKIAELMERVSLPTAFLLGGLVGLCEFPCTGGPYLMVLGLLHDQATFFPGLGYLLLYNLIFILPLVVILAIASNARLLEKARAWQQQERKLMRFGGGIAMVLLGTLIFFL